MTLEYTRLAQITGDRRYFDVVQRVTDWMDKALSHLPHPKGLLPTTLSDNQKHLQGALTFGGQGESEM